MVGQKKCLEKYKMEDLSEFEQSISLLLFGEVTNAEELIATFDPVNKTMEEGCQK